MDPKVAILTLDGDYSGPEVAFLTFGGNYRLPEVLISTFRGDYDAVRFLCKRVSIDSCINAWMC